MSRLILGALLSVSVAKIPAGAQHMKEKDSPCAGVVVTVDLANCLANARDSADSQLNAMYKSVRETLDEADAQRLIAAQRSWIRYRDANCAAERDLYAGGTASSPAYLACLEAMTRARVSSQTARQQVY